jgi:hypothetical protein
MSDAKKPAKPCREKNDGKVGLGSAIEANRSLVDLRERLLTELWTTEVNDIPMVLLASR